MSAASSYLLTSHSSLMGLGSVNESWTGPCRVAICRGSGPGGRPIVHQAFCTTALSPTSCSFNLARKYRQLSTAGKRSNTGTHELLLHANALTATLPRICGTEKPIQKAVLYSPTRSYSKDNRASEGGEKRFMRMGQASNYGRGLQRDEHQDSLMFVHMEEIRVRHNACKTAESGQPPEAGRFASDSTSRTKSARPVVPSRLYVCFKSCRTVLAWRPVAVAMS